eukprot:TRINITY_DN5798_c0_g1_i3.p2 TRINITY_DN5798_c0_g1~~TRINITY_DN5798_c0_g1_i3.p2  ORF type:complete len:103 (-),score=31.09 TRINITY_DN5798_c0_g1_i3:553-861(-)
MSRASFMGYRQEMNSSNDGGGGDDDIWMDGDALVVPDVDPLVTWRDEDAVLLEERRRRYACKEDYVQTSQLQTWNITLQSVPAVIEPQVEEIQIINMPHQIS